MATKHKFPKRLDDLVSGLSPVPLGDRLQYCMNMLYIWGMMTEAEASRVRRRIYKRKSAEAKAPVSE